MKFLPIEKVKTIIVIVVLLLLIGSGGYLYYTKWRSSPKNQNKELVVTEKAPSSIINSTYDTAFVDEKGNTKVVINGKEYVVMSDGSVWEYNEEGNLKRVTDPKVINSVLNKALGVTDEILSVDKDSILRNINLADLSDSDISNLAKTLGISEQELKDMVERVKSGQTGAKNMADAMQSLDLTTLSEKQLQDLATNLGVPYEKLKNVVDNAKTNGKAISLNEALKEIADDTFDQYIQNALTSVGSDAQNITVEDVKKALSEKGISMDDFVKSVQKDGMKKVLEDLGLLEPEVDTKTESGGVLNDYSDELNMDHLENSYGNGEYDVSQDLSYLQQLNQTPQQPTEYQLANNQAGKKTFLQEFKNGTTVSQVQKNSMKNMITAGTVINATLITGINTDLPGQITAIVSQNIYDSFSATNILIPKGSRLIATYDSSITWGQSKVLIAWTQLIRPDGIIISLNGYQGVNKMGFAGQEGDVNYHLPEIIGSTAMASLITAATGQYSSQWSGENILLSALLGGTATAVNNAANNILNRSINRQPTILVEAGTKIMVLVNDNVELTTYSY